MNEEPLGWAGRAMEWLRFGTRLVLINVLFMAGCIAGLGVFGIFPAAVAATTLLARLHAGAPDDRLVREFLSVYRAQFLHANRVGSIFWLAGVVLTLNLITTRGAAEPSPAHAVLLLLAAVAGLVTVLAALTAVTICSRYRDTVRHVWRTAFLLPLVSPVMSISLLVSLVAFGLVFSQLTVLVPLIGASAPLLVSGWYVAARVGKLAFPHPHQIPVEPAIA